MKRHGWAMAVGLLVLSAGCAAPGAAGRWASLNRVWFDNAADSQSNPDALVAHADLFLAGLADQQCGLSIFFHDGQGRPLVSSDASYAAAAGRQVTAMRTFVVASDPEVRNDFQVRLPYAELELPDGRHALGVRLVLRSLTTDEAVAEADAFVEVEVRAGQGRVVAFRGPLQGAGLAGQPAPVAPEDGQPPGAAFVPAPSGAETSLDPPPNPRFSAVRLPPAAGTRSLRQPQWRHGPS